MTPNNYTVKCYCNNCGGNPEITIPYGTSIEEFDYTNIKCELCGITNLCSITDKQDYLV